jgi:co-chaperonin GroES (HSP10)
MIVPNKNDIAVKLIEKAKVTSSGIILTSSDPVEVSKGRVVAVGRNVTVVSVNDVVLPNWNAFKGKFTHEDEELWIIPDKEIVGIFDTI